MESATAHPLQALADAVTIKEHGFTKKSKIVLTWAPHPKALPHAVGNSFAKMVQKLDADFVITQPKGYELNSEITKKIPFRIVRDFIRLIICSLSVLFSTKNDINLLNQQINKRPSPDR